MTDEIFWDSSPRFLFKQFDIHTSNLNKSNKKNVKKEVKTNKGEKIKVKVLTPLEFQKIKNSLGGE